MAAVKTSDLSLVEQDSQLTSADDDDGEWKLGVREEEREEEVVIAASLFNLGAQNFARGIMRVCL